MRVATATINTIENPYLYPPTGYRRQRDAIDILREHGLSAPPNGADRYYALCPKCSAGRSPAHQNVKCLGVTVDDKGVTWGCNHCDWTGGGYFNGKANGQARSNPFVAIYDYTDEAGVLLFQVCRKPDKQFPQRRPDGKGGWVWKTGDVRKVLYRLPELIEAIAGERVVFVVEGERDVENLRKLNVPATCNPGGASEPGKAPKWKAEYSEFLRGADITIVSDNDSPGRAHAETIARMSAGIAKRVRILDLAQHWKDCPKGGDISDWLAAGHTREQLDVLVSQLTDETRSDNASSALPSLTPIAAVWPTMSEDAFHGLAGDVVRTIEPHSEADPVAILIQFLAAAGNIIGSCPYHQIEGDRHHANLFAVLVGDSAKARKGTAWGRVKGIVRLADERWFAERTKSGLSSGEGFINEVRDPVKKWNAKEKIEETIDPGVSDKRLMVIEPEFAGVLAVADRHGNTLSPLMRRAWDGDDLSTMTRSSPLRATGAHISIVGHITVEELRARLTRTDTANGFANRFLFPLVRRSQELPFGGDLLSEDVVRDLGSQLAGVISNASNLGRVGWAAAGAEAWKRVYGQLSAAKPGLLGSVTARADPQCIRLGLLYALLDGATSIELAHIKAALAVWEYCEASAAHIFGASLGDPIADEILRALYQAAVEGMSRNTIRDYFGRNQSSDRIGAALALLMTNGRARAETRVTGGRPVEVWFAVDGGCRG